MPWRVGWLWILLSGCGRLGFSTDDASSGPDAAPDAMPPCDLLADFGTPVPIVELNTPEFDAVTDVSADELTLYLSTAHGVANLQLFVTSRPTRSDPFGTPVPIFTPEQPYASFSLAVTSDGLTGIVSSWRDGPTENLYKITRSSALASFDAGTAVVSLNTSGVDGTPRFSRDDATLYFDSDRAGTRDLYSVAVVGDFSSPQPIVELNSTSVDVGPVLSEDELTIYFASTRDPSPDGDIYMATRPSRDAGFDTPTQVTSLNSSAFEYPSALSADGCSIYLSSKRSGASDIFVARKPS